MFSTYVQNFIMNWHFFCSVRKRQIQWPKWDLKNMFLEQWFCLFCTEQRTCHFMMKFYKYVENIYIFITKNIQNFLKCFTIFYNFLFNQEHMSSVPKWISVIELVHIIWSPYLAPWWRWTISINLFQLTHNIIYTGSIVSVRLHASQC